METRQHGLVVRSEGRNVEVSNGLVLVRLALRDGGYAQEFCAVNSRGEYRMVLSSLTKDLITSSEHRASASPMVSGARDHLFAVSRDSLRMVYSDVTLHRPDDAHVMIELSGQAQEHTFVLRISMEAGSSMLHISSESVLPGPKPILEYLMTSYAFLPGGKTFAAGEEPDFTWAPNVRPTGDGLISDRAFFSPAAIAQHGRYAAALIPDLDKLATSRPMPAALDLDLTNGLLFAPLLSFGFCDCEVASGGRYFRHDVTMSRRLQTNRLEYAFDLIVDADCKRLSMAKQVARFMWCRYGNRAASGLSASRAAASHVYPDGKAAYGLWAKGLKTGRPELVREARAMRDMIVSAPQRNGLFPTRFDGSIGFWRGCNSSSDPAIHSTVECSTQLFWLLRLHNDFETHAETLAMARRHADALIECRQRSGAIPCWFYDNMTPLPLLRSSAPTAASAVFLAELAKATGLKKHIQACELSSRFVLSQILPKRRFTDERCADGVAALTEKPDPHTGMWLQGTQAMLWIAQLCLLRYEMLGERSYLNKGIEVLDSLCLMQSVGDKPWMPQVHGLLARGNYDPQVAPELSADFAFCAMRYGSLTGKVEYCERAAAALDGALKANCSDLSIARIAAIAHLVEQEFGSVYVNLAGPWTVELNGLRVDRFEARGSKAAIDVRSSASSGGRIVFGGLRGRTYELTLNGRRKALSREQMEAGVTIP